MSADYLYAMLGGYLLTVLIEGSVLGVGLSRRHGWQTRIFAAVWLTMCTYPIVWLVLPAWIDMSEQRVLYGHVFRNAMLLIIAGFPGALIGVLFTGALLIEVIFTLDGLGLLGFEAALNRDYPVMFGTLYFFTLLGLLIKIISDLTYTVVDPRIDFERRG